MKLNLNLKGSEKQVRWAKDILKNLEMIIDRIDAVPAEEYSQTPDAKGNLQEVIHLLETENAERIIRDRFDWENRPGNALFAYAKEKKEAGILIVNNNFGRLFRLA